MFKKTDGGNRLWHSQIYLDGRKKQKTQRQQLVEQHVEQEIRKKIQQRVVLRAVQVINQRAQIVQWTIALSEPKRSVDNRLLVAVHVVLGTNNYSGTIPSGIHPKRKQKLGAYFSKYRKLYLEKCVPRN